MVHCSQQKEWKGLRRRAWVCSPKLLPHWGCQFLAVIQMRTVALCHVQQLTGANGQTSVDCGLTSQPSFPFSLYILDFCSFK